jgi:hypothetical protein
MSNKCSTIMKELSRTFDKVHVLEPNNAFILKTCGKCQIHVA